MTKDTKVESVCLEHKQWNDFHFEVKNALNRSADIDIESDRKDS